MDNPSEQKYLSSKDAGAILGYTHDYVSRLCRQGHMSGIQKGREWYVTQEEIDAFKARHEVFLAEKKKELSKKFSQIRRDAEAKKREAREEAKQFAPQAQTSLQSTTSFDADSYQKKVTLTLPKEFAAIAVLAFALLIPTVLQVFQKDSVTEFSSIVEQGIQKTIDTQAQPVASIFAFAPYFSGEYQVFFNEIGQLPKETYLSMRTIGNSYLMLYLLQGQALYETVQSLNTMGGLVLRGYELIGEAFLYGSKDIFRRCSSFLSENKIMQMTLSFPQLYVANVSGGFEYVKEDIDTNVFGEGIKSFFSIVSSIQDNIGLNVSSIQDTVSGVSHSMGAYLGSLFEFNLIEKESKIKAIKLQK